MPCRASIIVLAANLAGSLKIDSRRHELADFAAGVGDAGVAPVKKSSDSLAEMDVLEQALKDDPQLPDKVKKPLMNQINVIRTEMCWARPKLMEHEKCVKFLGLHCSKGSTGKGICKKFKAKVTKACNENKEEHEDMHKLHCDIAEDLENAEEGKEDHHADDDGDGVPNCEDLFPDDPNESEDLDMDGVGDNSDDDIDGDGFKNNEDAFPRDPKEWKDTDGDGVGDNHDDDDDGDGVPNAEDEFPDDPTEFRDLDGDGVGDHADEDRDGDGHDNVDDPFPDDPTKFDGSEPDEGGGAGLSGMPENLDQPMGDDEEVVVEDEGAGISGDIAIPKPTVSADGEVDSDGDGVKDTEDDMPNDPTETKDTDADGIGDSIDAFPEDPSEQMDSDGDGVGDNSDHFPDDPNQMHDSDHDGIGDRSDAFPNNPREQVDSDHDGVGDNADAFPHNAAESMDSDADGVGDNSDPAPFDPNCNTAPCPAPSPAAAGATAGPAAGAGAGAGAGAAGSAGAGAAGVAGAARAAGPAKVAGDAGFAGGPAGAPAPALAPAAAPGAPGALEPLIKPWELNKVERALPPQGYNEHSAGYDDVVEHNDMDTWTGDWGKEWPTKHESEKKSISRICDLHPNSIWCKKYARHGHFAR